MDEILEEVQKHLDCKCQNWLFGAGISFKSNIPLMVPLTKKIEDGLSEDNKSIYDAIKEVLTEDAHIEVYLSHIGDLLALIERTKENTLVLNNFSYTKKSLLDLYKEIISKIGEIIRYGYDADSDTIGTIDNPLIEVKYHQKFVQKLFNRRSNLENITEINFFTTNYDTLLEDALSLEKREVVDGFTGGAMGYWNLREFDMSSRSRNVKHNVYKLHGSIDWYEDDDSGLLRCRFGTKYLSDNTNLLIYPQATKYIETQKDPFALLFSQFRSHLKNDMDNILSVCGYSFGDNHINAEIESAMSSPKNKTNLIVFTKELWDNDSNSYCLPEALARWLKKDFRDRVFILTNRGVYNGRLKFTLEENQEDYNWWTFEGLTDFIS